MGRTRAIFQFELMIMLLSLGLMTACQMTPQEVEQAKPPSDIEFPLNLTLEEAETINSLKQIDPYPLYTMNFYSEYDTTMSDLSLDYADLSRELTWGCSLFAVFGDPDNMLLGRNFDWDFSPGLLLFTDPPGGYASVSMVDMHYLGYGGELAFGLPDLSISDKVGLLDAPYLPFDGMNEVGLAIGMAAVPERIMTNDPNKETIDSLMVIRKVLDNAASVDDAVSIIKMYNIDWDSGPPLHYMVAEENGRSVLVEFSNDEIVIIPNSDPWQSATNFLVAEAWTDPSVHCWRYDLITDRLSANQGVLSRDDAMGLLEDVAQESTQWSVVYRMSQGEIDIVMGGEYQTVHTFELQP